VLVERAERALVAKTGVFTAPPRRIFVPPSVGVGGACRSNGLESMDAAQISLCVVQARCLGRTEAPGVRANYELLEHAKKALQRADVGVADWYELAQDRAKWRTMIGKSSDAPPRRWRYALSSPLS
jgi:hypothetical protein